MRINNETMDNCALRKDSNLVVENHWFGLRRIGTGKYDFIWSDGTILRQSDYANWSKCLRIVGGMPLYECEQALVAPSRNCGDPFQKKQQQIYVYNKAKRWEFFKEFIETWKR